MRGRERVVVVGLDATPGEVFDQLRRVVGRIRDSGVPVEVLLTGDGEMLRDLRALAPVTVADHFRRRGVGAVVRLVGSQRLSAALKSLRLRRWVARRSSAGWLIHHPAASSALRVGRARPRRLAACLPVASMAIADLDPLDAATLAGAAWWLTRSDDQERQVHAAGLGDASCIGPLRDLPDSAGGVDGRRVVVLVPSAGAWDRLNHTAEIAAHVRRRHPGLHVEWVASGIEDRWLARHDIAHLGLGGVTVVPPSGADVAHARAVVKTGYGGDGLDLCHWAADVGVPVVGFDVDGIAVDGAVVEGLVPFAVDALLERVDDLLSDEQTARTVERCDRRRHVARDGFSQLDRVAAALGRVNAGG